MKTYAANGDGTVAEVDIDEPSPGADELLLEVHAFSVNRGEINQLRAAARGWRPGWDVAGVVQAAAADGSGPAAGTRIVGWVPAGAWSERVTVRTDRVAVLPEGVAYETAAALPVAGITARRTLGLADRDLSGAKVFVTGGAGGVGSFAVCLGRAAGASVYTSARGEERVRYARNLGAESVLDSIGQSGDDDFDLILESAGGLALADALRRVTPGGVVVTFGNSSRQETTLNIVDFYRRTRASLKAFALVAPGEDHGFGEDLGELVSAAQQGVFDAIRVEQRSWTDLPKSLRDLEDRAVLGKTVVGTR